MRNRKDVIVAAMVASAALALYVATLLPDVGGPEDTPKFQFLGYVLGTAHPPGYPLYVLLSHAFVQLPIRTIAYRANLFSAVMAALACGVSYVIARQIGSGRWTSACAALALAAGVSFWRSAVFAEVYSLAAVIAGLTIALLLSWDAHHDAKRLLAAVGTFALGLGNHLTIVGLVPSGAWFILVRNRKVLTLRLLLTCVAVLCLGIAQYWFIVVRSTQGAPYVESRATSISELVGVVTAERFANERFSYGPKALLTVQLPVVASGIRDEMGMGGVLVMFAGLIVSIWQKNAAAILVLGAAAGLLGMVLNLAGDFQGFITPVMVLLWPLAALGIQTIADAWGAPPRPRYARPIVLAAAAIFPIAGVVGNYDASDHSRDTEDARFLRAVYAQLPDNAGIVAENYWYAMVLNYLTFTKESGPQRGIRPLDSWAPALRQATIDGRRVFAFGGAATFLRAEGLQFQRAPLRGALLDEWLKRLPRSSLLVGATAYTAVPIESLPIDHAHAPVLGGFHPFSAFTWVAGEPKAVIEVGDTTASIARGNIVTSSDARRARIEFDGHIIAEVDQGTALAVFSPGGELLRTLEFGPGEPPRVGFQGALYEFTSENACADVTTDRWTDIAPVLSAGSWVAALDAYGSVTIETEFSGSPDPRTRTATLMGDGTVRNIGQTRSAAGTSVIFTELVRPDFQRSLFRFAVDRSPDVSRARLKPGGAVSSVKLCADAPVPLFAEKASKAILRPDFESEAYFGPGWGTPQRSSAGTLRFADGETSTLLLPLDPLADYRVALNLEAGRGTRVSVTANGVNVGECEPTNHEPCEVRLPRAALRKGINWVALATSHPDAAEPRPLSFRGARLQRIDIK